LCGNKEFVEIIVQTCLGDWICLYDYWLWIVGVNCEVLEFLVKNECDDENLIIW